MSKHETLSEILTKTSQAHGKAFKSTNGEDKDWPKWYAKYLLQETNFAKHLAGLNTKTLAHLLELLDHQFQNDKTKLKWPDYYSKKLKKIA